MKDNSKFLIPGAIVLAAVVIGGALYMGLSQRGGTDTPPAPKAVNIKDVKIDGNPYIGKKDAPATLVYWSDHQCPFCKAFEIGGVEGITNPAVMPDLIKKYVDTGKLKIVFKDYPFLGEDSMTAAEYEHAIWELYPAQFYAWRVAVLEEQDEEGDQGFGDAASIDQIIAQKFPQMDGAKIRQALVANKAKYDTAIDADREEGSKFGVKGTPGFITGTSLIPGFYPLEAFVEAIDPQLK